MIRTDSKVRPLPPLNRSTRELPPAFVGYANDLRVSAALARFDAEDARRVRTGNVR